MPPTLRGYRASWLGADALAGLTLVAVAVPSQMATARLADLPAVAGLYAFVAGSLFYALLGTNRHLSVGADSTIAPVLAVGVASVAAVGTSGYGAVMAFTALLVGGLLVAVGLLPPGVDPEFLSTPVITGVLAGIAVEIVVRQIPIILGVTRRGNHHHRTDPPGRRPAGHTNGWSVGIAVGVLAMIAVAQRIDHRLPGALLGLILSIVAVDALGSGVPPRRGGPRCRPRRAPARPVAVGLLVAAPPAAGPVLTVAFVCIAQTAATVRRSSAGAPAR